MTHITFSWRAAATIMSAVLMLALDAHPAHPESERQPELVPADTVLLSSIAEAGGTGQARAYWRNAGGSTTLTEVDVEATAPEDQVFQPTGELLLRTSRDDSHWVPLPEPTRVEQSCDLGERGRAIRCTLPTVALDGDTRLSVGFPTFVAPGAEITTHWTSTSNASLAVQNVAVKAPLKTFVGALSAIVNRVDAPEVGERTVRGEAHPGSSIELVGPDGIEGNASSSTDGAWSITLPEGSGMVEPRFIDVAGQVQIVDSFYYDSAGGSADSAGGSADSAGSSSDRADNSSAGAPGSSESAASFPGSPGSAKPQTPTSSDPTLKLDRVSSSPSSTGESVHVIVARLLDGDGAPISGASVEFAVDGHGELTIADAVTDDDGKATVTVVSASAGRLELTASAHEAGSASRLAV